MQYAFSFVLRGEQKMEGERFSFEMPHFSVMADETPKTCIETEMRDRVDMKLVEELI